MNATRVTVSDYMLSVQASKFPARTVQSLVQHARTDKLISQTMTH